MLDIAKKYEKELQDKFLETWYDMKYQYYRDSAGDRIPQLADNCYERRDFVSLDNNGEVIGFISYFFDEVTRSASRFGIINFGKSSQIFARDLLQVIADIFFKFNLNRIEWWCFADNPATKGYRSFIKRFGGKEAGYFRSTHKLMDGNFHDSVGFEILREDLVRRVISPLTILNNTVITELEYQTSYRENCLPEYWGIDEIADTDPSEWTNIPKAIWEEAAKDKERRRRRRERELKK